ncbi:MAG: rpoE 4 [Akkermansiaceae bacterium]|nr:rpoE 4 [Akkermansiaceae bacterium]
MLNETEQISAIQRVLDGDIEAFASLVTTFQAGVLRMAYAITGDRTAAEDISQDSFVAAFRHLESYDASRATFPSWLHAIVRNTSRNFLRHRKSKPSQPGPDACAPEQISLVRRPDEALGVQEEMGSLDAALASLPVDWRRAFTLTEIEGLPYAEAAVMEGVPIGTIRSRVHRSRKYLQNALNPTPHINPFP